MGDSSVLDYCNCIKSLVEQLDNMGEKVSDRNLFAYALNGLCAKYQYIILAIRYKPTLSFWEARTMLLLEETNIQQEPNRQINTPAHMDHLSLPIVLATEVLALTHNNRGGHCGGICDRYNRSGGRTGGQGNQQQKQCQS